MTETTLRRVYDITVIVAAAGVSSYLVWVLITTLSWLELAYSGVSLSIVAGLSIFITTRPAYHWLFYVRRRNG